MDINRISTALPPGPLHVPATGAQAAPSLSPRRIPAAVVAPAIHPAEGSRQATLLAQVGAAPLRADDAGTPQAGQPGAERVSARVPGAERVSARIPESKRVSAPMLAPPIPPGTLSTRAQESTSRLGSA
jgi:hypothetical protein